MGSIDGKDWQLLHAARIESHLMYKDQEEMDSMTVKIEDVQERADAEAGAALSRRFRHPWTLDPEPQAFFRYFRVSGVGDEEITRLNTSGAPVGSLDRPDVGQPPFDVHFPGRPNTCLHVSGFELYGEVHEA